MAKGPVANPTPGTMVVRLGVRVFTDISGSWSNLNQVTTTRRDNEKLYPQQFGEYMRIYPGVDAMAANGLRYGAAVELRQNFVSPTATTGANGGTGYTSTQTVYVRRAFAYLAGDSWGIVRFGEMDGLIGTYDNGGQTTGVFLSPTGTIVGGDLQSMNVGNAYMTPFFAAQSGNEYGNTKFVYLSPAWPASISASSMRRTRSMATRSATAGCWRVACNSAPGGVGCPNLASTAVNDGRLELRLAYREPVRGWRSLPGRVWVARASSPMASTWAAAPSDYTGPEPPVAAATGPAGQPLHRQV